MTIVENSSFTLLIIKRLHLQNTLEFRIYYITLSLFNTTLKI